MLLKYFYDKPLAHASYLIGCQKTGEALVIDPSRNVNSYLETAKAEGLRITAAAETHIHADFVSGSRELADQVGARLLLSDEGPADWKYGFADVHGARLLKNADVFHVGKVKFEVLHTPGHTPEHISYLLTDEGGGATTPMGIFTGDFVFVGAIGRPDLLETAAGVAGSAVAGARQIFRSLQRFRSLADHCQVWPAHGAGSACGKGLGAVPSSTVGYEKLVNPALQFTDEETFITDLLADQPETPPYFAIMKRVNKFGPPLVRDQAPVVEIPASQLQNIAGDQLVIDLAAGADFAQAHVPSTINVPAAMLVQWAGFFADYDRPLYLIADSANLPNHLRSLRSIGIDRVGGFFDASAVRESGLRTESYRNAIPRDLDEMISTGRANLIDVRAATEFNAGHIPQAEHRFLGALLKSLASLDRDKPVIAQCQSGARSAIASSILQRAGFNVTNMLGGIRAWDQAGLPVVRGASQTQ
jgi:hydroxyacylglutathione hydrolase